MEEFKLDKLTHIVVKETARPNLKFTRLISDGPNDALLNLIGSGKRCMIICMNREDPIRLGNLYNFTVFPSSPAVPDIEKGRILQHWSSQELIPENGTFFKNS